MGSDLTAAIPEAISARVASGARLTDADVQALAATPDLLALGMLADDARRRRCGGVASFVRVAVFDVARLPEPINVPDAAGEVRLEGTAPSLDQAVAAVRAARAAAGARPLSGFCLAQLVEVSAAGWGALGHVLSALAAAGLDQVADVPVDRLDDAAGAIRAARAAGLAVTRLTIERPTGDRRAELVLRAREVAEAVGGIAAFAPLPAVVPVTAPTTGYDDVRLVAVSRLALDTVAHVQVDWRRYGPKLAQVALAFGADDVDGISPEGEGGEGRRRAPLEDIRRQIQAAGLQPRERDGRYASVGA